VFDVKDRRTPGQRDRLITQLRFCRQDRVSIDREAQRSMGADERLVLKLSQATSRLWTQNLRTVAILGITRDEIPVVGTVADGRIHVAVGAGSRHGVNLGERADGRRGVRAIWIFG